MRTGHSLNRTVTAFWPGAVVIFAVAESPRPEAGRRIIDDHNHFEILASSALVAVARWWCRWCAPQRSRRFAVTWPCEGLVGVSINQYFRGFVPTLRWECRFIHLHFHRHDREGWKPDKAGFQPHSECREQRLIVQPSSRQNHDSSLRESVI